MVRLLSFLVLSVALAEGADTLLVLQKGDDSLGFYDAATGKLEARVAVGKVPHEFAVSADEKFAYVTNYGVGNFSSAEPGGNSITIVDLKERKATGEIPLGEYRRPHGIVRGKSGLLYVTTDYPAALLIVDGKKRKVNASIPITGKLPQMVQLTTDERKAWTADAGSGTVSLIDIQNRKQVGQLEVGGIPMDFALTSDEKRLLVATSSNNMVVLVDAVANKLRRSLGVPGQAAGLLPSKDGRRVYATLIGSGEVAVLDPQMFLEIKRVPAGAAAQGLALDPTGEYLYVSAQDDNKVIKLHLPDLQVEQEIETQAKPDAMYVLRVR
jgi:DNA-binding beta-propeller fold protein YncE